MKNNLKSLFLFVTIGFGCVFNGCDYSKPQTGIPVGVPVVCPELLEECFAALRRLRYAFDNLLRSTAESKEPYMMKKKVPGLIEEMSKIFCGLGNKEAVPLLVVRLVKEAESASELTKTTCVELKSDIANMSSKGSPCTNNSKTCFTAHAHVALARAIANFFIATCEQFPFSGDEVLIVRANNAARAAKDEILEVERLYELATRA